MRPENWENPYRYSDGNGNYYTKLEIDQPDYAYEASADALWKSVCDYIAELSNAERDDKMFRVKLFLWLTKEEK